MTSTPQPVQRLDAPAAKPRVALWDNARFAFIVLVVVGHLISTIRTDTDLAYGMYVYFYAFHMPAMILLSGVFAKAEFTRKTIVPIVQLLALWLVWEGIWALIHFFTGGNLPGQNFLVTPAWTLWFLVSLATMRILLPFFAQLRHPLIASVVIALIAGVLPAVGTQFSASRTLCLMPFFMLGWLAKRDGWFARESFLRPKMGARGIAWGGLGLFAIVAAVLAQVRTEWRFDYWILWRYDYQGLFEKAPVWGFVPDTWWEAAAAGGAMRLVLLALAAALTIAAFIVLPRRQGAATVWGSRTLYVYLLHGPIVQAMRATGVVDWFGEFGVLGIFGLIVIGIALAIVLSMSWVVTVFKPIIEPPIAWLFSKPAEGAAPRA